MRHVIVGLAWSLVLVVWPAVVGAEPRGEEAEAPADPAAEEARRAARRLLRSPPPVGSVQVYPEQNIPLRFDHRRHLELGMQCVLCHGSIPTSEDARDRNLPDHRTCGLCHRMELPTETAAALYPKASCVTCHPGHEAGQPEHLGDGMMPLENAPKPDPIVIPPARLTFSHKLHVDQGLPCLHCHGAVPSTAIATREHLPNMAICLECHDGGRAPKACATCHLQGGFGRLDARLDRRMDSEGSFAPRGRFRPDNHSDPEWVRSHDAAAVGADPSCSACHGPSFCLSCHDGVQKPFSIHPADWSMTHGMQAMRRTLDCASCHDQQSFCEDCHSRASLVPGRFPSPSADPPGSSRFHPEGWGGVLGEAPGVEHHSAQARRSLESCAACHTEDQCIECHAFVDPHPESFTAPPEGWHYGQGTGSVCTKCHRPGSEQLGVLP